MKIPPRLANWLYWREQRLRGRAGVRARYEWLLETQYRSPAEIEALQRDKLRDLIAHAWATVPYYRRIMDERGLTPADVERKEDLRKLPLLERDALRTQQDALLSSQADTATLSTNYSSGSTGQRAVFKQDQDFRLWMRAHQLRTYGWCADWKVGEPFALLWGSEIYWSSKQLIDHVDNLISNRREYNTFRLSRELVQRFLRDLVSFRPVLISTYTNAMSLIAREAERQGLRIPELRCIQGTSEPLPPAVRETLTRVFGCEVYDKYGSRETNIVSHECPKHEAMHIQAENVVVEVVDDHGDPVPEGQQGRMALTTLNNRSMPLIRYITQDLAAAVPGSCSCGIGLPRMTSVAGRLQDLIHTPSGDSVDAYFFSYLIMRFEEIHWFQVIQSQLAHLHIKLFVPHGIAEDRLAEIRERIAHHTGYPFTVEFEQLTEMPETPTGKFRLCVSEIAPQPV